MDRIKLYEEFRKIRKSDFMVHSLSGIAVIVEDRILLVHPKKFKKDADKWSDFIADHIINDRRRPRFDWKKETVQMLGRWQPWHLGHRKLFERAIAKTGQVVIQIRDCQGWNGSNPFSFQQAKDIIQRDLDPLYQGQFHIQLVPNIVHITYGRDVGYKIEQEILDESTQSISATKIRVSLGLGG